MLSETQLMRVSGPFWRINSSASLFSNRSLLLLSRISSLPHSKLYFFQTLNCRFFMTEMVSHCLDLETPPYSICTCKILKSTLTKVQNQKFHRFSVQYTVHYTVLRIVIMLLLIRIRSSILVSIQIGNPDPTLKQGIF
jgi:hypothetical protein